MPNYIDLPIEFMGLQGKVQWVQKVNDNEYTSSCPRCGINPEKHSDMNPSDRLIMWLSSRSTGKPFAMCYRGCGFKWSPEKQDAMWTDEEIQEFKRKRIELIERDNERIETYAREVVMKQGFYKQYTENLKNSTYGNQYLASRGFKYPEWNRLFGFGIVEDYFCKGFLDNYYSPAITMAIKSPKNLIENIKFRVAEAHHTKDRFRNQYKSGTQHIYLPMGEEKIMNKVAIMEGEMKSAMVAMKTYQKLNDVQILGTQGDGIGARMLHAIKDCEVVYLSLDPDCFVPNEKGITNAMMNAKKIGYDRVRFILSGKQKMDDAILQGFNFINAYNMAVKPERLGLLYV